MSVSILTPSSQFNFDSIKMDFIYPVSGQSGVFFSNITVDNCVNKNLYLQLEECSSKQGVVSNKGIKYIEIKIKRDGNENIINWFEKLEFKCNDILDENKEQWFQTELSRDDIEVMMDKTARLYTSGKFIIIKVAIDLSSTDSRSLVFDENNNLMDIESITPDTTFIPLIMIEGVRCFSKRFEIVVRLVQLMVTNKQIEKHCLIKRDQLNKTSYGKINNESTINTDSNATANANANANKQTITDLPKIIHEKSVIRDIIPIDTKCSEITEVDIVVTDNDSMTLKDSEAIYYELYKEALLKAKRLKSEFIAAYFNANKIKMAHNLEIDSDEDNDIN